MFDSPRLLPGLLSLLLCAAATSATELTVDRQLHHIRSGSEREWSDFLPHAEASAWEVEFELPAGFKPHVLLLRQRDVKQTWNLSLDEKPLGKLLPDENDTIAAWPLPADLAAGKHKLTARSDGRKSDDIMVGAARILEEGDWTAGHVTISVQDADSREPLPCRITVATEDGALMALGATSNEKMAVRPGVIYTSNGQAEFTLPTGRYRIFASRGFEYGMDRALIDVRPGGRIETSLSIRREVPTPGYISCDTHCHTFQFSRHGDATLDERLLTLAGEGIEWPISTDHNLQVDYDARAQELGLRKFFTPVVGSEVTTKVGHFNVFPLKYPSPPIDFKGSDWAAVSAAIRSAGPEVVILNHARDLHSGFRPFGPDHRVGISGENLDGWTLDANAMEVVNSGATQTDPLLLPQDWMTSINRGQVLTPVGSSDSHDVSRFIVGQGRTYVRCQVDAPGKVDTAAALKSFRAGHVQVSMGLLTEIVVNDRFGSGDLVPGDNPVRVHVRVSGPSWTRANRLLLYVNGLPIDERTNPPNSSPFVWEHDWTLPLAKQDVHVAAIALGPGIAEPFWAISKPYQPTSNDPSTYVVGCSGVVFIDADRSGRFDSSFDYAQRIINSANGDLGQIIVKLADADLTTSIQAASLLQASGVPIVGEGLNASLATAAAQVRDGFRLYRNSWKESMSARLNGNPASVK